MAVVYWQIAVIGSVAIAFFTTNIRVALWIAIGWTVFTLAVVFTFPLAVVQLLSCWIPYAVCNRYAKQRAAIKDERDARKRAEEEARRLSAEVASILKGDVGKRLRKVGESALREVPTAIRMVRGAEHLNELCAAFKNAKATVCILSGWLGSPLLKPEVQTALESALSRGVDIYIGYGFTRFGIHQEFAEIGPRAAKYLSNTKSSPLGQRLHVAKFSTHEKLLVVDDAYFIIGSNNWLSNGTFQNSESSMLVNWRSAATEEGSRIRTEVAKLSPEWNGRT